MPIAVLVGGALYDYSYPGLLWPAAVIACWAVAEVIFGGMWRRPIPAVRRLVPAIPAAAVGAAVLLVIVAPDLERLHHFYFANGGSSVGTVGGVQLTGVLSLGTSRARCTRLRG